MRVRYRMIRYTLRDLFWLTVVVAFAVLWWGETRQRKIESSELWEKNSQLSAEWNSAMLQLEEYRKQDIASPGNNSGDAVAKASSPEPKRRTFKLFVRRMPRYL